MAKTMDGVTIMIGPVPGFSTRASLPAITPDPSSLRVLEIVSRRSDGQLTTVTQPFTDIPTAVTITKTVGPSNTQGTNMESGLSGVLPTTTMIAILIPITILITSVPTIWYLWWQRRQHGRRKVPKPKSIKYELEAPEQNVEIDGTRKQELEAKVWVQELGGRTICPKRKELEALEKAQELEAR